MVAKANRVDVLIDTPSRRAGWYVSLQPKPVAHCLRCGRIEPADEARGFECWTERGADRRGYRRRCKERAWRKRLWHWAREGAIALGLCVGLAVGLTIIGYFGRFVFGPH